MRNKLIWIDDNPDRERTADDLGAQFINVNREDLEQEVGNLLEGAQPRLVILDHILDRTTTDNPLFRRGSTIAEAIKEKWPLCPVIGVTNVDLQEIDLRTRRTYDDLVPYNRFSKYIDRIDPISRDFAAIAKVRSRKTSDLIKLLDPPDDEFERLEKALPDELKVGANDPSAASNLFRWVGRLMDRPGFLYDSLWAATFLGLNEDGFAEVQKPFVKCMYSGVFSRGNDPRWWLCDLSETLYKLAPAESGEMSWHAGRRLPKVRKSHFSKCYKCRDAFPETVAYLDAASPERRAMHLRCTVLHPRFQRELYFEDIRMMQGE